MIADSGATSVIDAGNCSPGFGSRHPIPVQAQGGPQEIRKSALGATSAPDSAHDTRLHDRKRHGLKTGGEEMTENAIKAMLA
ncbi:hypothetical protein [Sphingomonas quercus]|uniref:Uncharacterized protein n=1 Tax=Sphingomonas quercus TaxID=2842451 RepID=A0ABS6BFA5_9SPHN|nr:hypothetical protein [Sphingomonas quercus]MBU3076237.1 hypothetical protein [Sphingomonas quercus]